MAGAKRKEENYRRRVIHMAKRKAEGRTVAIDCPRCGGKVGIPFIPKLKGVGSDPEKMIPLRQAIDANYWLCANEKCGYGISGESLQKSRMAKQQGPSEH